MNIAFDATALLSPSSKNRGIGNYTYNQFINLIRLDKDNQYFFFNLFEEFSMADQAGTGNVTDFYLFSGQEHELISKKQYQELVGDIIRKFLHENQIDIFYITSPFELMTFVYKKEWFQGVRTVATVYDIIPYVMKERYLPEKESYETYMERVEMLRWVDMYLVISQSVKDDMISYLKFPEEKIHVIYGAGTPNLFRKIEVSEGEKEKLCSKFKIKDRFLMCTGGDDERKNLAGLIKAYAKINEELRDQYQLVIVCKLSAASVERYTNLAREFHVKDRVVLTNFVTDEELVRLYNLADLMVFPSLYEGFGLPILEAWQCGTPVLTSANSSLQEIGGEAAILVNAASVRSVTEGIEKALSKTDLKELARKGMERSKQFTWEKVSRTVLQAFEDIITISRVEEKEVKRIAMFTPLPPIESGIADYSVDILSQLIHYFTVDVYVDKYKPDFKMDGVTVYSFDQFEGNWEKYDRIIYQVGNSLFHEYMFPFIKEYPGIVVLHDYNLRNVLEAIYLYKNNEIGIFGEQLREDFNEDVIREYLQNLNTSYLERFEVNGFVTNYASRLIVHSEYAGKKLLEREISRDVWQIPLYCVVDDQSHYDSAREEMGIKESEVVFAAFGHIHENKRVLQILAAFSKIYKQFPEARLYFVGKMAAELSGPFEKRVKEYGIGGSVTVTGYIGLDDFERYMEMADVCLNLRYPYNGESSASLMRLLGKGKCVVINRIGSFAEIPGEACIMIDNVEDLSESEEIKQIYEGMLYALDADKRENIESCARGYAKEMLDLKKIGKQYAQAIRRPYQMKRSMTDSMLQIIAKECILQGTYQEDQLKQLAKTLAYSLEN